MYKNPEIVVIISGFFFVEFFRLSLKFNIACSHQICYIRFVMARTGGSRDEDKQGDITVNRMLIWLCGRRLFC